MREEGSAGLIAFAVVFITSLFFIWMTYAAKTAMGHAADPRYYTGLSLLAVMWSVAAALFVAVIAFVAGHAPP